MLAGTPAADGTSGSIDANKHLTSQEAALNTVAMCVWCTCQPVPAAAMPGWADLHELSVDSRPDLIELAHNSMLSHINGHFGKEDLATLPQQLLVWQPMPAVVHFLYLQTMQSE